MKKCKRKEDGAEWQELMDNISYAFAKERPIMFHRDQLSRDEVYAYSDDIMMLYPEDVRYYLPQIMMELARHPAPCDKIELLILFLNGDSETSEVGKIPFSSEQIKVILSWLELFIKPNYYGNKDWLDEAIDEALLYWMQRAEEAAGTATLPSA
jgi:hypothetical protein